MIKRKLLAYSITPIILSPLVFTISCSSTSSVPETNKEIEETKQLKTFIATNQMFKPLVAPIAINQLKSILSIYPSSIEDLKNKISSFASISAEFEKFLNDNQKVWSQIKRIDFAPQAGTTNAKAIVYLKSAINDSNVVGQEIQGVYTSNFTYVKEYLIEKLSFSSINFINGKNTKDSQQIFKNEWNQMNQNHNLAILKRVFNITTPDDQFDLNDFVISYNSAYEIKIELKPKAIEEGKIIKISSNQFNPYWVSIQSLKVIK